MLKIPLKKYFMLTASIHLVIKEYACKIKNINSVIALSLVALKKTSINDLREKGNQLRKLSEELHRIVTVHQKVITLHYEKT